MPIQFKLDDVIERATMFNQGRRERSVFKELTGVALPPGEALRLWPQILDHKWLISERLGRDVGLRVAAVDFLENMRRLPGTPFPKNMPAARLQRAVKALLGFSDNRAVTGETSLAAFESALHGTRSLAK
ncbi:MAG TPA: DUF4032 domain-containing protein [Blastocatellia bacterium]|nr:DUF4032 domain-containing protein [Blastocatellia bacterium]